VDKLLNLIGLAKKAGKLEVGEEPVGAAARSKHARLILIASDAADNTRRRALHFGEAGECICLEIPPTKEDLGRALGRTSCALLALTDIGFAEAVAKKLAESDEAHYGEAAKRLAIKAARAAQHLAGIGNARHAGIRGKGDSLTGEQPIHELGSAPRDHVLVAADKRL